MVILVVDDDAELREALAHMLGEAGYTVQQAGNGVEALAVMRGRRPPDLILLDVYMPVMDGWQFLSARLADPALVATPIILMSAMPENKRRAAGVVSDFVAKPVPPERLLEAIDHCRRMFVNVDDDTGRMHREALGARRVLVVEDDAATREVLCELLEAEHFEVRAAHDGREAMLVLHEQLGMSALPTVILCDLRMPVMDGWALWQALRQDKVLSAIPLVLMSGNPYELNKLDDSVIALAKPVGRDALLSAIAAASA